MGKGAAQHSETIIHTIRSNGILGKPLGQAVFDQHRRRISSPLEGINGIHYLMSDPFILPIHSMIEPSRLPSSSEITLSR